MLALAAAIAPATAADLPIKAPPLVAAAVYNWVGFYVGVHGGGGWAKKVSETGPITIGGFPVAASSATSKPSGWLAGGQIGYNFYQSPDPWWFGGRVVIGVEAQGSWADLDDTIACSSTALVVPPVTLTANCTSKVKALGTVALRYGTAWDRFYLYSKIGFAWASDEYSLVSTTPGLAASFSGDETRFGWMSGTGAEIAMGNNWSIKGEYNYMGMGKERVTLSGAAGTFESEIKQRIHVVKFGLNYRFGGGAVVARY
jgi:outer membrane immunogenic protein